MSYPPRAQSTSNAYPRIHMRTCLMQMSFLARSASRREDLPLVKEERPARARARACSLKLLVLQDSAASNILGGALARTGKYLIPAALERERERERFGLRGLPFFFFFHARFLRAAVLKGGGGGSSYGRAKLSI